MAQDTDAEAQALLPVRLSQGERHLVLNCTLVPEAVKDKLRLGVLGNALVTSFLSAEEAREFADCLAAEIEQAKGRPRQVKLDDIHEHVAEVLEQAALRANMSETVAPVSLL